MLRRLIDAIHLLSLALWLCAIAGAGIAAMGVFSTLPEVGLEVPAYRSYFERAGGVPDEELPREHGRLAGGMVMAPIFAATDRAQIILAAAAIVTLVLQLALFPAAWPLRRRSNILRTATLAAAALLLAFHAGMIAPRMDESLRGWWEGARSGDVERAAIARTAFDHDHLRADALFRARGVLVLAAIAFFATASVRPRDGRGQADDRGDHWEPQR
ncbi:MAG TPA: hypothetical protein PKC43_04810 [Phycisphaerales bacterium]|nr:hypothetical protein [Phycisphaerales bacterium]HMP36749.1 hypothetical protein [Phycisphaerales bacterium]